MKKAPRKGGPLWHCTIPEQNPPRSSGLPLTNPDAAARLARSALQYLYGVGHRDISPKKKRPALGNAMVRVISYFFLRRKPVNPNTPSPVPRRRRQVGSGTDVPAPSNSSPSTNRPSPALKDPRFGPVAVDLHIVPLRPTQRVLSPASQADPPPVRETRDHC